jgi:hypothetical protein
MESSKLIFCKLIVNAYIAKWTTSLMDQLLGFHQNNYFRNDEKT